MIYLASPYTHADPRVEYERYTAVTKISTQLLEEHIHNISPILFNVPMAPYLTNKNTSWEDWRDFDIALLDLCTDIFVLLIDGWKISKGVRAEVKHSLKNNIKVHYLHPECIVETPELLKILKDFNVTSIDELND